MLIQVIVLSIVICTSFGRLLHHPHPQFSIFQVWNTPSWRRLVPQGVLHVNWDPFRPRRSHKLPSKWFPLLSCNNAFAKAFDQNKPLTVFLQRRGSYLHPQSKDEDIGVLIIYNLYIYQLCDKLFKTNSLKSSTLIFCCLATKFLKVKHQRSGVITIVFR